jgi:Putative zinc-finger
MKAHLSGEQIGRYLTRTLSPADILALHEHTDSCADCREALAEAAMARQPCANVPSFVDAVFGTAVAPHLSEEEMVAFAARRVPESRWAQASRHVAECGLCMDSVSAMESVRDRTAPVPVRHFALPWFALAGVTAAALLILSGIYFRPPHSPVPPQPAVLASLRDGTGTIQLDAQGRLRGLDSASAGERDAVREALERGSLPSGSALPAEAPGVLLGPGSAPPPFAPLGPLNTLVLSDRPEFTWQPYSGAERYQVLVTNENLDPLARSGMLTATQWQPDTDLPRGVPLLWQVRAWKGGEMISAPAPPAPPARFEIAAAEIAARIEQLRASPAPSHLLAAVLCAEAGLREEAAKELHALAQENPGSKVVESLQAAAGR